MATDQDDAMQDFAANLFARAADSPVQATADNPVKHDPPFVPHEGTLSKLESKLDRAARHFIRELFGS